MKQLRNAHKIGNKVTIHLNVRFLHIHSLGLIQFCLVQVPFGSSQRLIYLTQLSIELEQALQLQLDTFDQ